MTDTPEPDQSYPEWEVEYKAALQRHLDGWRERYGSLGGGSMLAWQRSDLYRELQARRPEEQQ